MKYPILILVSALTCTVFPAVGRPEETSESEPVVEGAMLGGEAVLQPGTILLPIGSSAGIGPVLQYWGEKLGIRAGMLFSLGKTRRSGESMGRESEGATETTRTEQNISHWAADLLGGLPVGRTKPYISAGIGFGSEKSTIDNEGTSNTITIQSVSLRLGLGVDFAASEHLVLGLGLLRYERFLDGSVKGSLSGLDSEADLEGDSFGLLNSFSVRYVF